MTKRWMMLLFSTLSLGLAGCGSSVTDGCSMDADCKDDRVCSGGECVESGGGGPAGGGPGGDHGGWGGGDDGWGGGGDDGWGGGGDDGWGGGGDDGWGGGGDDGWGGGGDDGWNNSSGGGSQGGGDVGDTCTSSSDCADLCVAVPGNDYGYCTTRCGSFDDCPDFWSCEQVGNTSTTYCVN